MTGTNVDGRGATVEGRGVQAGEVGKIPDSAVHRWILDDAGQSTVTDYIGSVDGTNNSGINSISGNYQGGSAGDGGGSDEIDLTNMSNFDYDFTQSDFTIAFTVDNFTGGSNDVPIGGEADEICKIAFDDIGSGAGILMSDSGADDERAVESGNITNDGNKHRVVWLVDGFSATNFRLFIDNSEQSLNVTKSDGASGSWSNEFWNLFSANNENYFNDVIDDVILYDSLLTNSEIEDEYNAQPWT